MSSSPSSNKAAAMTTAAATCGRSTKYKCLRSYPLLPNNNSNNHSNSNTPPPPTFRLTVAQGSVVDFRYKYGAIVNAANEGCLGGGGVDGAISNAGGPQLALDREALPIVRGRYTRCPTGQAKLTGPASSMTSASTRVLSTTNVSGQDPDGDTVEADHDNSSSSSIATYGDLGVPYVIHAVGPNYMHFDEENDVGTPNRLLRSAYQKSLDCCKLTHTTRPSSDKQQQQQQPPIRAVGFSLLSAGIFRGDQALSSVLSIGVEALRDWARDHDNNNNNNNSNSSDNEEEKDAASNQQQQQQQQQQHQLEEIILFAFTDREAKTLLRVCDWILLGKKPETKSKESSNGAARKMDPPGEKVETSDSETNSDTSAASSSEENRKTVEASTVAETKGTVPDDAPKKNTEKPDPEAGQSTEDKVMTDVEDNDPSSGAEESIAKSSLVPSGDTVQDNTTKEDKVMTDTEEEAANMVAKDQSSTEMKRADETQKTTTTTICEDKVMTDVESFEDSSELPESESSSNKGETATCTAGGDEKALDAAATDQKESN